MSENMQALRIAAECEKVVLENGLTVLVKNMPGFRDVHVLCGTRFGSADTGFVLDGEEVKLPAGVAHFLEHKMFESEEGDAFEQYAAVGASANAYTSFDKTCYLFSTTSGVDEAMDILLKLVSRPYFTKQTVEKEQGIIGQEIRMYDDSAEWRMMFALLQGMYHSHPVREDIAGTVESIAEITPEMLYKCTDAFYAPENLVLAAAGNVTMRQVLDAVERAGFAAKKPDVCKVPCEEPRGVACRRSEFAMSISRPYLGVGYKEEAPADGRDAMKRELVCDMLSELVCGAMTPLYRRLYDSGLAGADFAGEFLSVQGALCVMFSGETENPEETERLLKEEIARLKRDGVDEELFTLCKNQMYGEMVCDLDSVTGTASALCGNCLKGYTLFETMSALAALTRDELNEALRGMLCEEHSVTVVIRPDGSAEPEEDEE